MRGETRQNLFAIAIAFGILLLAAALFFRPAILLGAGGNAVAGSLGRAVPDGGGIGTKERSYEPHCDEIGDSRFRCGVAYFDGSQSHRATYEIEVGRFGCWEGWAVGGTYADRSLNGCIWLLDY